MQRISFSIETHHCWITHFDLWEKVHCVPRIGEYINISMFLSMDQWDIIDKNSESWSGDLAIVTIVTLCKDKKGVFYEVSILCEDFVLPKKERGE